MRLECFDCHAIEEGDVKDVVETMRLHVRSVHQRELAFDEAAYNNMTSETRMASTMLLHPELILSA